MLLHEILERFVHRRLFTVMVRGVWENLLRPEKLDSLWGGHRRPAVYPQAVVFVVGGVDGLGRWQGLAVAARRLPGAPDLSLVVIDSVRGLATQVLPCEAAHAQERALLDGVIALVRVRDLWIADRHCCTAPWVSSLAARSAFFLIRHQGRSFAWKPVGNRRPFGRTTTGRVFAQTIRVGHGDAIVFLRRVTILRDEATTAGDQEIHLLTNLPAEDANACPVAELYRRRWPVGRVVSRR